MNIGKNSETGTRKAFIVWMRRNSNGHLNLTNTNPNPNLCDLKQLLHPLHFLSFFPSPNSSLYHLQAGLISCSQSKNNLSL